MLGHTPVTPQSLAHMLASIQVETYRLQYGWRLTPTHLRALARIIGHPASHIRRIQEHPNLAAHLALAHSAGWIAPDNGRLTLTDSALHWLHKPPAAQIDDMLAAFREPTAWLAALQQFHLTATLTIDLVAYYVQQLDRFRQTTQSPSNVPPLRITTAPDHWVLTAQGQLTPALIFDLAQFATGQDTASWHLTPFSLARACEAGYSLTAVRATLFAGLATVLTRAQEQQLTEWANRVHVARVESVRLLTTAQPAHLNDIMSRRALRRHVLRRIGPRHAVVTSDLTEPLRRHLAKVEIPFATSAPHELTLPDNARPSPGANQLTALHVLTGLRRLVPFDLPGLIHDLSEMATAHSEEQQAESKLRAATILDDLQRVIQGRDAFFPSTQAADPTLRARLEAAIAAERPLLLDYEGPGDLAARRRIVEPYWVETIGALDYLHAYCRLSASDRTFRLDRIRQIDDLPAGDAHSNN